MTLSRPGKREAKKADHFRRIVAAARDLLAEKGFHAVRMEEIAQRAGLAVGTAYNYIDHKGDLLLTIVIDADRECVAKGRAMIPNLPDDPVAALTAIAEHDSGSSMAALDKAAWRQVLAASIATHDSDFALSYAETTGQLRDLVTETVRMLQARGRLRDDVDPVRAADTIHAMKYMMFVDHVLNDAEPFAAHMEAVTAGIRLIVDGIGTRNLTPEQSNRGKP